MTMDYFKNVDIALKSKVKRYSPDFTKVERGLYLGARFDDVSVYDLVTRTPNSGSTLDISAMHSLCHIFDSYVLSSKQYASKVILFAPSASATGFNLVVRSLDPSEVILLLRRAFEFIRDFEGELPNSGNCANLKDHDLDSARKEATLYLPILNRWTGDMTVYSEQ